MKHLRIYILIDIFLIVGNLKAQTDSIKQITFSGQVTAWGVAQLENSVPIQFGGRFVPTLLGNFKLTTNSKIDFEASANINGSADFTGLRYDNVMVQLKPYRVWARYSGSNWEVRAGLQKINAQLKSLQYFYLLEN